MSLAASRPGTRLWPIEAARTLFAGVGLLWLSFLLSSDHALGSEAVAAGKRPDFATTIVTIKNGDEATKIPVELAVDFAQRQYGLMHIRSLPEGTGMLFVFPGEGIRSFWMKNTLIPLDMLFFDGAGRFVSMHEHVAPPSFEGRRSAGPAQYVLEINGGEAKRRKWGRDIRLLVDGVSVK